EVVDGEGVNAGLGEAQSQLLVERIEAANIGQDHHPGPAWIDRPRPERRELAAVRAGQDKILVVEGAPRDRPDRRVAVEIETHRRTSKSGPAKRSAKRRRGRTRSRC